MHSVFVRGVDLRGLMFLIVVLPREGSHHHLSHHDVHDLFLRGMVLNELVGLVNVRIQDVGRTNRNEYGGIHLAAHLLFEFPMHQ